MDLTILCCFTYLAGAVHAVATHGTVRVRVAVAAGRKVAAGAVHAESAVAVKVSGAVAAGGEGAALAVDAVSLVVAVGGAKAVAALMRFRSRACENSGVPGVTPISQTKSASPFK